MVNIFRLKICTYFVYEISNKSSLDLVNKYVMVGLFYFLVPDEYCYKTKISLSSLFFIAWASVKFSFMMVNIYIIVFSSSVCVMQQDYYVWNNSNFTQSQSTKKYTYIFETEFASIYFFFRITYNKLTSLSLINFHFYTNSCQ